MTITSTISRLARDIAEDLASQTDAIRRALQQVEVRKAEIEQDLRRATAAYDRLERFAPKRRDDLQCPRCWIGSETSSPLTISEDGSVVCVTCKLRLFPPEHSNAEPITDNLQQRTAASLAETKNAP
jgi:hypothetical protein